MALRIAKLGARLPRIDARTGRDPRVIFRALAGALLAANLVAAFLVIRPIGGSAEELEQQLIALRREARQRQTTIQNLKALAAKVEKGRAEGDRFISQHFLARRTAYSTLMAELGKSAQTAGIKPKEHSFNFEPIEGSDTLGMLIVTANYEGSYADLVQFVNALDRSGRLLIVESLTATPQQTGGTLNVAMRLNAFVQDDGSGAAAARGSDAAVARGSDAAVARGSDAAVARGSDVVVARGSDVVVAPDSGPVGARSSGADGARGSDAPAARGLDTPAARSAGAAATRGLDTPAARDSGAAGGRGAGAPAARGLGAAGTQGADAVGARGLGAARVRGLLPPGTREVAR